MTNYFICNIKETVDVTLAALTINNLKNTKNPIQISKLPTLKINFLNHFQNGPTGQ